MEFLSQLWRFLRGRRKLWLLPIILACVVLAGALALAQGSALAPLIYTLF